MYLAEDTSLERDVALKFLTHLSNKRLNWLPVFRQREDEQGVPDSRNPDIQPEEVAQGYTRTAG